MEKALKTIIRYQKQMGLKNNALARKMGISQSGWCKKKQGLRPIALTDVASLIEHSDGKLKPADFF